ncbi:MAG: hypothetical protein JSU07_01510 [Bacteroidetes bacterium]|nr:hypothetical protein [Bacteroidota bacterium]
MNSQNSDDLLKMVDQKPAKEITTATFKTTRLINFHTIEVLGKRSLDFRISHRFGDMNQGVYQAWGIDGGANIRLGLEYSHDGRFMFGIGRTSINKIVDGFLKYRLLRQDNANMPISITLFSGAYHTFERTYVNSVKYYEFPSDRLSFCNQIMIARKFNSRFSLQITGAMVHVNLVPNITDKNDCYIVGAVARYKFTKRQAITIEYGYRLNNYSNTPYYNSFGVGYDIETGGHVFQVHFTNSTGLTEDQYFMYSQSNWSNWGIRLGFNISRVFTLQKRNYDN